MSWVSIEFETSFKNEALKIKKNQAFLRDFLQKCGRFPLVENDLYSKRDLLEKISTKYENFDCVDFSIFKNLNFGILPKFFQVEFFKQTFNTTL